MRELKVEAVILDAKDIYDADRSLLLFSRELGKVYVRARGVRKPTSRLTGNLLPYLPTQLELVRTGDNLTVVQAQVLVRAGNSIYPENPLLYLKQVQGIAEALNRLFIEREPHPAVYGGLIYVLERLRILYDQSGGEAKARLLVTEYLLKCLVELGYRPQLDTCVATGLPLDPDFLAWSDKLGGTLSETGYRQMDAEGSRLSSKLTVVALREFLKPAFSAERLKVPQEIAEEAGVVARGYLQYQIGAPLRAFA